METDAGRHRIDEEEVEQESHNHSWSDFSEAAALLHRSELNDPGAAGLRNRVSRELATGRVQSLLQDQRSAASVHIEASTPVQLRQDGRIPEAQQKALVASYRFDLPLEAPEQRPDSDYKLFIGLWVGRHSWYARVMSAVVEELSDILSVPAESINDGVTFSELGMDSFDGFELSARIETTFGVLLTDRMLADFKSKTIADSVQLICLLLAQTSVRCGPCDATFSIATTSAHPSCSARTWRLV